MTFIYMYFSFISTELLSEMVLSLFCIKLISNINHACGVPKCAVYPGKYAHGFALI